MKKEHVIDPYEYWYSLIPNISCKKKQQLLQMLGSAKALYETKNTTIDKILFLTEKEKMRLQYAKQDDVIWNQYRQCQAEGIAVAIYGKPGYPKRLEAIADPPYALFYKGRLPEDERPSVATIGARQCTAYGEQIAIQTGELLAQYGIQVVSGMAKGIDGASQRGVLNKNGDTFAVLGCGVDICYPAQHRGLYQELKEKGGILSEYPIGTQPLKQHFPARNRLISGLADVVIIFEARERSGSFITCDMALEQGKDVYALPGPITSNLSRGCNDLIRQGAGIFLSVEQLLDEIDGWKDKVPKTREVQADKTKKKLGNEEYLVYSKFDAYPISMQKLLEETELEVTKLVRVLTTLMMEGYIAEVSKNYYVKRL